MSCSICLATAACLEACRHPSSTDSPLYCNLSMPHLLYSHLCLFLSFIAMPKVDNLAKGWIGSVGSKMGAAVVHAAKIPT